MERNNENDRVASLECEYPFTLRFCDFLFASLGNQRFQNVYLHKLFLREQNLCFSLTKSTGEDSLFLTVLTKYSNYSNILAEKNVRSFCIAKAIYIFFAKMAAYFRILSLQI